MSWAGKAAQHGLRIINGRAIQPTVAVKFIDNVELEFGTLTAGLAPGDVSLLFDGTNLEMLPAVDDTGAFNIGDGTTDMDLKVFMGAAAAFVEFDVSEATVEFDGVDLHLKDADYFILGDSDDIQIAWDGTNLTSGPATGFWSGCPSLIDPDPNRSHGFYYDFKDVLTLNNNFLSVDDAGTGTNTTVDVAKGAVGIVTAAGDNDYHVMSTASEAFLFVAGKKLWFEARFRVAEAATNESAWWFGFTSDVTTGGLQADAAGPLATYDGALIWKDEATMEIDFETSNAGTQATGSNIATFVTNTWTRVGFYFDGTATTSTITPYVDGTAYTAQNITLAGLEEMHFVMGIKAGPANNAETLEVDYVKVVQLT